jgi:hypothetical protein
MRYYRYDTVRYSDRRLVLVCLQCDVESVTKRGVWVSVYGMRKFVLDNARKRYAYPTVEQALESFHARKRRQVQILRARLQEAEAALTLQPDAQFADLPF